MTYSLASRSEANLRGVHPDLVRVVRLGLTYSKYDFGVGPSVRTMKEQIEKLAAGLSKTTNSRHIPDNNECKLSCAVDLNVFIGGAYSTNSKHYSKTAKAMFRAAIEIGIQMEWGGHWESIFDGPHFQLSREEYP